MTDAIQSTSAAKISSLGTTQTDERKSPSFRMPNGRPAPQPPRENSGILNFRSREHSIDNKHSETKSVPNDGKATDAFDISDDKANEILHHMKMGFFKSLKTTGSVLGGLGDVGLWRYRFLDAPVRWIFGK